MNILLFEESVRNQVVRLQNKLHLVELVKCMHQFNKTDACLF